MKFIEWLYSSYPNPHVDGQYGLGHILTMVCIAIFIVLTTIFLKKKSQNSKRIVLFVLATLIFIFEVARRVINLCKTTDYSLNNVLRILLPRPGCAISCWLVMASVIVNKRFLYCFTSIVAMLSGLIFFVYPGVGYNNQYILFENLYSIVTHALLFTSAICFITYGFADFKYKTIWKELICFAVMLVYVFLEIYVLKIESDPFYFMPGNDVQEIVGLSYGLFLPIYIIFVVIYFNIFYLIGDRKTVFKRKKKA